LNLYYEYINKYKFEMKRKFNYFYKITNIINGNFYYGIHKTNNLNDGYLGSGKRIQYALKKYGIENFEKEIVEFFDTYEESLNFESEFVTENLILDPSCYNLKKGGSGGWDHVNKDRNSDFYVTIGGWKDYEKRIKVWKSVPSKKRIEHGKKLGKIYGGKKKFSENEIQERLELIKSIDLTKWGWVKKVSEILNISHTQTRRFMDKYYKEEIYKRKKIT